MVRAKKSTKQGEFRLGFVIHDVSRLRRTVVDNALKPLGVTRSQWWVLAHLSRDDGESMMQTELAKHLDVGKVALGGLIDRLEANGYIVREADPLDRRAKRIKMTPEGVTLLNAIQERASVINREMLRSITAEEIRIMDDVLHRLKARLIEMDREAKHNGEPAAAEDETPLPRVARKAA